MVQSVLDELEQRGFIAQTSNMEGLRALIDKEKIVVYGGFDPSFPSLHMGNLVLLMMLAHFQRYGHTPIALLGGATGMIGSPSGKDSERHLLPLDTVAENIRQQKIQMKRFIDFDRAENPAVLVNNIDWLGNMPLLEFLREVGKYATVNVMIKRELVRNRIEDPDKSISFAEFSYMLLQGYDFLHLYDTHGCKLQIGGTDEWGNIISGVDLVRKKRDEEVFALVCPLITRADGRKFGKTEEGALYLDPIRTTPYALYQYWVNIPDTDVIRFLKIFTFLSLEEIATIEDEMKQHPEERLAQRTLAREVVRIVHGDADANAVRRATAILFENALQDLDIASLAHILQNIPNAIVTRQQLIEHLPLEDALLCIGFASSRNEARRIIEQGGVSINNERQARGASLSTANLLLNQAILLKVGKRYGVLKVQ